MPHGTEHAQAQLAVSRRLQIVSNNRKTFEWSHNHLADATAPGLNQLPTWCMPRLEQIMEQFVSHLPGDSFHVRVEVVKIILARSEGRGISMSIKTPHSGQDELRVHVRFVIPPGHRPVDLPMVECVLHDVPHATMLTLGKKVGREHMKLLTDLPRSFNGKHAALFVAPLNSQQAAATDAIPAASGHVNGSGHRENGMSLAASGPSVILAQADTPTPVPLTVRQIEVIRGLSLCHGIYEGRGIDADVIARMLGEGPRPIEHPRDLISMMVKWGFLEGNGTGLSMTDAGYAFCYEPRPPTSLT